jgi:nitronate monooxygenase
MWPDRRLIELFGIEHPILLAPMAGPGTPQLAIAVAEAGGLGSLPCAMLGPDQMRADVRVFRARVRKPVHLNFFVHTAPEPDTIADLRWRRRLAPYYEELGIDRDMPAPGASRVPFDEAACAIVEELRPEVVSFHFGLPEAKLLDRVIAAGAKVIGCATAVREAQWLEDRGCVAVIAQGLEAGGHRGMFLTGDVAAQMGTMALVPQIVDAITVPVIAAGGIADARAIAAAMVLGAAGVAMGTAYLLCPEAGTSAVHRTALQTARDGDTALTNLFTGRPARGVVNRLMTELGPMSNDVPEFPLASGPLAPLRAAAEALGSGDFSPLWSGRPDKAPAQTQDGASASGTWRLWWRSGCRSAFN